MAGRRDRPAVRWPALLKSRRGAGAVEFALISPIILIALFGMVDFGLAMFEKMELVSAVRSGAQHAFADDTDLAAIEQTVRDATNLDAGAVTVTAVQSCECADGTALTCGDTCGDGSETRFLVTITATKDYSPIFLPTTISLSGSTVVRTQ